MLAVIEATEALRNGFNIPGMDPALWNNPLGANFRDMAGQGAKGFEQLMAEFGRAGGPFKQEILSTLGMPAFGLAREHQERWQALGAALVDYQEQTNRYNALILKSSQQGFERFQSKLAEREEPGRQLESVRAVYDLWIDAAEEAYADPDRFSGHESDRETCTATPCSASTAPRSSHRAT